MYDDIDIIEAVEEFDDLGLIRKYTAEKKAPYFKDLKDDFLKKLLDPQAHNNHKQKKLSAGLTR